jgi:hypothetical protein
MSSVLNSAFYYASRGLGLKDRIVGSEFLINGVGEHSVEHLVALETSRGSKKYNIVLEKLEYFHGAGTFPIKQHYCSGNLSKEEAAQFIIKSDEKRLETLMDEKGIKGSTDRASFKAKFYNNIDMSVNHASRVILALNENDGRILFPKLRPKN